MLLKFLLLVVFAAMANGAVAPHIVGGDKADYGAHPYICSLQQLSSWSGTWSHVCGAVIYNTEYIVTAAHCVDWSATRRVVCGLHKLNENDAYQVEHSVQTVTKHPSYGVGAGAYPNDIAVMKLRNKLTFNDYVKSYDFSTGNDDAFINTTCTLSGWGLKEGSQGVNTLKEVKMRKVSNEECKVYWGSNVNAGHVCFLDTGKSACNGDSGGPVLCGPTTIMGITSWGQVGCPGYRPSVYTRVSYFHNWLVQNTGGGN